MNISNVKFDDIKKYESLKNKIQREVISKYNFAEISFKEIIEFINEKDEFKLLIFYPDSNEYDKLITYLKERVQKEVVNRLRSGEIRILKNALDPYRNFMEGLKNINKILDILENTINNIGIQNEDDILEAAFTKIDIIPKIIEIVIKENKEKIQIHDYSFAKNQTTIKFIKIYLAKSQNTEMKNSTPNELDKKIASNELAIKVKDYLLRNNIILRHIYIILFRFNLFDYEKESISYLSSFFGLSKERIALDQDKAIQHLFLNNLIESFCKLFPHPKATYQYLLEIYKNGYNAKLKPNIKVPKPSIYTQNLTILTNTTKAALADLITRLNVADQKYINDNYNQDYELINPKKIDKVIIKALVRKLNRLASDINYKPANNKNGNLTFILNIPAEKLQELLSQFAPLDQKFIYKIYDNEFNHRNIKLSAAEYSRLNKLKKELIEAFNNPSYDPRGFKNLYKRLGITPEDLEIAFLKLTEEEQTTLKDWYDENWDEKVEIQSGAGKRQITKIVTKIRTIIKTKKTRTIKIKTLYDYFNITKEELINIISKLDEIDQILLKKYYSEDFIYTTHNITDTEEIVKVKNHLKAIKIKIRKLIKDPEYLIKKKQRKTSKRKTLYESLNVTKDELIELIAKLSSKDQNIIQENYDNNYYKITDKTISEEEKVVLNGKVNGVRNKLRKLISNPNYQIRNSIKKEKVITYSKGKTLYELLNLSKEEVESIILKLNETDRKLLTENYDAEYYRIKRPDLNKEEISKLNGRLYLLRKKILKFHENPNYQLKNKQKKKKEYVTLYGLLNITKEELEVLINRLNQEDQTVLENSYDEEYRIIRQKVTNEVQAQLRRSRLSSIRKKLRDMINPKKDNRKKSLDTILNIKKSKLQKIIIKLPKADQEFIKTQYDENFEPISSNSISEEDKVKNRNKMASIRAKIRKYIDCPNYSPNKKSRSLCARLNTDFITTNKLLALLNEEERTKVLNAYDELDNYKKKSDVSSDESKLINAKIIPKLKRYLSNGLQARKAKPKKETSLDSILEYSVTKNLNNSLNILELIIMTSIATGERYSTSSIAKFLGIEESVVQDMLKHYLLNCQEKYNKAIEEQIKQLEKPLTLSRKKDNKKEEIN